jgi:hypothetical protein
MRGQAPLEPLILSIILLVAGIFYYSLFLAPTPEQQYATARVNDDPTIDKQLILDTNSEYGTSVQLIGRSDKFYEFLVQKGGWSNPEHLVAVLTDGYFETIWAGEDSPTCSVVDLPSVPAGLAPTCYDDRQNLIERTNSIARMVHSFQ